MSPPSVKVFECSRRASKEILFGPSCQEVHASYSTPLPIAAQSLFRLDSFKERLEISSSKSRKIVSLDDLDKECWSVHQVLQDMSVLNIRKDTKNNVPW